jgi:hypothetical protein
VKSSGNYRVCSYLAGAVVGAVLLGGVASAQDPPRAASSAVVSGSSEAIEPVNPAPHPPKSAVNGAIAVDPESLLPDLPPLPRTNATLVGGTIQHLDRVRDRVTLRVFGGGKSSALIDPRTQVYVGDKQGSIVDLHEGQRAYLDTILDGSTVFARVIRVGNTPDMGSSQGVVEDYRQDRGELTIRDGLSPMPIRIRLTPSTKFTEGNRMLPASSLRTGSLIKVAFDSQGSGHDVAREISILAAPGTHYTFSGEIIHIDLRTGLLVINSPDRKTYEIYLDPSVSPDNLHAGAEVTAVTDFENARYVAHTVTVNSKSK